MVLSDAAEARRQRILLKRKRAKLESEQHLGDISDEDKIDQNGPLESGNSEAEIKKYAKKPKLETSDINNSSSSNEEKSERPELDIPDSKTIISNVYRYLKQEYKYMKLHNKDADLSILSPVRARTAAATGVTRTTVSMIVRDKTSGNTRIDEN